MSTRLSALLLTLAVLALATLGRAQTATGEVNGTVTDTSGASVPGAKAADVVGNTATYFNPCAFAIPVGSFGNLGRDTFRGPAVFNLDTSLFKSIPIRERWALQLRFEAFNAFNVQNWDSPSGTTIGNANAGQITGLAPGTSPRQLQFGLRLNF